MITAMDAHRGRPARRVDLFRSLCPPMERVCSLKAASSLRTRARQNVGTADGLEVIERTLGVDGVQSTIVFRISPERAELLFLAGSAALA